MTAFFFVFPPFFKGQPGHFVIQFLLWNHRRATSRMTLMR
jgi:hypothetical protein